MSVMLLNPFLSAGGGGGTPPTSTAGLFAQYAGRAITGLNDADPIASWNDISGNGRHLTQATSGRRPLYKVNIINSLPAVLFDGTDDRLTMANVMTGLTEGEIFIVLKLAADPPAGGKDGLWKMDTASQTSNIPFSSSGVIFDGWGSTARKTTVNPTDSMAVACLYNVSSKSAEWTSRLNGAQIFQTLTNTVGFGTAPEIGRGTGGGDNFVNGHVAEVRIFDHVLSGTDRDAEEADLGTLYGITIAP